jgi:hypothetical protein
MLLRCRTALLVIINSSTPLEPCRRLDVLSKRHETPCQLLCHRHPPCHHHWMDDLWRTDPLMMLAAVLIILNPQRTLILDRHPERLKAGREPNAGLYWTRNTTVLTMSQIPIERVSSRSKAPRYSIHQPVWVFFRLAFRWTPPLLPWGTG